MKVRRLTFKSIVEKSTQGARGFRTLEQTRLNYSFLSLILRNYPYHDLPSGRKLYSGFLSSMRLQKLVERLVSFQSNRLRFFWSKLPFERQVDRDFYDHNNRNLRLPVSPLEGSSGELTVHYRRGEFNLRKV